MCPKKYLCANENKEIITNKSALSGLSWRDILKQKQKATLKINDVKIGDKFIVLRPKKVKSGVVLINSEYELKI